MSVSPLTSLKVGLLIVLWFIIRIILRFIFLRPLYSDKTKHVWPPRLFIEYAKRYWYFTIPIIVLMVYQRSRQTTTPFIAIGIIAIVVGVAQWVSTSKKCGIITMTPFYRLVKKSGFENRAKKYFFAGAISDILLGLLLIKYGLFG